MENNINNTDDTTDSNIFRFSDKATDNFIEIERNGNVMWINVHYVDENNCKLFLLLLKTSINKLIKLGCTKFRQLVLKSDWKDFLSENKEWTIVEENINVGEYDTLLIECNSSIAHELITDGFLRNNKTF